MKWNRSAYLNRKVRASERKLRECLKNLKQPIYEIDIKAYQAERET